MPGAIIYNKDEGLIRGIQQAGESLSQSLNFRNQESKKKQEGLILEQVLQQAMIDPLTGQPKQLTAQDYIGVLTQASKSGIDPSVLQPYNTVLSGVLKEQARTQGVDDFFKQWQKEQSPPLSGSIEMAKETENIATPQEAVKVSDMVEVPGFGRIHPDMINAALRNPREEIRRWGEGAQRALLDQQKSSQKEGVEIRKEWRQDIRKYTEPYKDTIKLQSNVNKLKEAQRLIDTGKVSLNENWFRNAVSAILEDKESSISDLIKTKETQKLWYLLRDSLKPKEIGGSNPSTREVLIAMSSLPGPYKGQLANEYIIQSMINDAEANLYRAKTISSAEKKAGPISPNDFKKEVEESTSTFLEEKQQELHNKFRKREVEELVKTRAPKSGHKWVMDPQGIPREVPIIKLKRALQSGGTLLNDS